MAEIVVLNVWRDRKRRVLAERPPAEVGKTGGQVVLFTGVRYERWDTASDHGTLNAPLRLENSWSI